MRIKGTAGLLACLLAWAATGRAGAATAAITSGAGSNAGAEPARVSLLQSGSVELTRGDDKTPVTATLNAPLIPGDAFAAVDRSTLAEIQLDGFSDMRLGDGARGRIVSNDAHARRIELTGGLIELSLLRGQDVTSEIATPSFTLRTRYAGAYRVAEQRAGTASITLRGGQADIVTPHKTLTLRSGETLVVRGSADDIEVESQPAAARDAFDDFNAQRDRTHLAALDSDTHVPPSIAGYDDLDTYGRWTSLASYGPVWVPNGQNADWAPYRDGRWSYVGNDGWTWVGNEPWAWVPYHYGRWLYSSGYSWCWYPPPMGYDPVWAPALVGFFGNGGAPGFSDVGWVPLAPFEPYVPYPYPWSAGPPRHYYPPPPPPPVHHRGPPAHMSPLAAFQNARFGGASAIDASSWHKGDATEPVVPRAVPGPHAELPARDTTPSLVRPTSVSLPVLTPSRSPVMPVFHVPATSHSVHPTPAHPPA